MTGEDLLDALNSVAFADRYWELCDRHPLALGHGPVSRSFTKRELADALQQAGLQGAYDSRDRTFSIDLGNLCGRRWTGVFAASRRGSVELMIDGSADDGTIGSNFAVLAYAAKQRADPSFSRDSFGKGPPPYPRPEHNGDLASLQGIAAGFVELLELARTAIAKRERSIFPQ